MATIAAEPDVVKPLAADADGPAEDWDDPATWPAGAWDLDRYELGESLDGPTGQPLADALRAIAASYRSIPSRLGALLAEAVEDLIGEVEITQAATVAQLRDRRVAYLEIEAR